MATSDKYPQNNGTPVILAKLKDIASSVIYAAEASNLEQVLERIAHVAKELVNARYAALGIPDGQGGLKYFKVAGMTQEAIAQLDHLPLGHGLIGAIMRERKSIRLERMVDDSRSVGFCRAHPPMTSLLGVPVLVGQQLFGTLYLCDRIDGQPFTEQDEWLIETIAGYAALAIAGSQLGDQQKRLTLLEERERIGMELHDGVIQSLYAIGMHLDLMRLSGDANPKPMSEVIDNLNQVIEDIRRYIMNLRRDDYHHRTIAATMREMIGRLHTPPTMSLELDAPEEPPLFTPATFEAVCQMANEAISNAVRHSHATVIHIRVRQGDGQFEVVIEDDGKGFDLNNLTDSTGLGLRNIQQRAVLHGGHVTVDTAPGKGTRLTITMPLQLL